MISDILTLIILLLFIIKGYNRPDIAMCSLVWINAYKPQETSFGFLSGQPLSMFMTLFFFVVLFTNFRKIRVPSSFMYHFLALGLMLTISISTYLAQFPEVAFIKYDTAIKTLIVTYLIPFVIITKKQIELFVWTAIISLATFAVFAGVKSLLGGGGYGTALISGSSMWTEGSILTNQMISLIPVCFYLYKSSEFAQSSVFIKLLALGYALCCVLTLVGTQARSGLVCLAILSIAGWIYSKHKVHFSIGILILPLLILPLAPDAWFERMSTIQSTDSIQSEKSAMGRVMVWRWTIDYVSDRPFFGGGFYSYMANSGQLQSYAKGDEVLIDTVGYKAFHNIIFEVLGENGYVGLFFYLGMLCYIFFSNLRNAKSADPNIQGLARACIVSLLVYCAGGMFVNYSMYPWLYFVFGITVSLNYYREAQQLEAANELANAPSKDGKIANHPLAGHSHINPNRLYS